MHPKEIEKVVSLEPLERYKYFIKKSQIENFFFYVTNSNGDTSQFFLNLPFGEISAGDSPIPLKKINIREANDGGAEPAR